MRIINGKSSKKTRRSSAKKLDKEGLADDLFYTAEEFIAELTGSNSNQVEERSSNSSEALGRRGASSELKNRLETDETLLHSEGKQTPLSPKDLNRSSAVQSVYKKRGKSRGKKASDSDLFDLADQRKAGDNGDAKKEYNSLLAKGIRLLSMREHSVKEISRKLSQKSESLDLVYAVIDELVENNYLSDQRFAESYVRSRQNRGFGPNKIKMELKEKGIENNLIDDFLNANSSVWYESAEQQYFKKYGSGPVDDYKTWARRARFMQSRGFSMEHIDVVVPAISID